MYFKYVYRRLISLRLLSALFGLAVSFLPALSQGEVRLGVEWGGLQENRSLTSLTSVGRTIYDASLSVDLDKRFPLFLTVGYLSVTSVEGYSDPAYATTKSTAPYAGLAYYFMDKNPVSLMIGAAYSPVAKAVHSRSEGQENWNGSSSVVKIGFVADVWKALSVSASMTYISESFNEKTSGTVTSNQSYEQSYFLPSLGLSVHF